MYVNNISPALQLELDLTLHIQWYRNQVVGNCAIHRERAIREIKRMTAVRFTTLWGKRALNSGVGDTNFGLLRPARASHDRRASDRRVNVDFRKVQHSYAVL